MNIDLNTFVIKKNKWESQQIHKKHNRIQYASKHYGKASNIIYKRKHPVKQRKDIKKFKAQRRRKKIYKQMSFDFDDFIFKNKNENFKRIQIKPKMNYQYKYQLNNDIQSIYNNYYNNSFINIHQPPKRIQNKHCNTNINGIKINIKLYIIYNGSTNINKSTDFEKMIDSKRVRYCPDCTFMQSIKNKKCCICYRTMKGCKSIGLSPEIKLLSYAKTALNIYKINGEIDNEFGTKIEDHSIINIPIFCKYLSKIQNFSRIKYKLLIQIANKALKSYKTNNNEILNAFKGIKSQLLQYDYELKWWYISFCDDKNKDILIKDILFEIIPNLWIIYDFLLDYIGYKSINVLVSADLKLDNLTLLKKQNEIITPQIISNKNNNNGMSYYKGSKYKRNRLYSDIIKDIKSYIPSYIFYKEKENISRKECVFYNIGEYSKQDWRKINFFGEMDWTKMNICYQNKNKRYNASNQNKNKRYNGSNQKQKCNQTTSYRSTYKSYGKRCKCDEGILAKYKHTMGVCPTSLIHYANRKVDVRRIGSASGYYHRAIY